MDKPKKKKKKLHLHQHWFNSYNSAKHTRRISTRSALTSIYH